ncbi:MAG: zf-HC2 domain-containing protein [Actinobacteria bacterium]|nr:zf-HC2 domain-containing protein [Actinomycetota bacterium]
MNEHPYELLAEYVDGTLSEEERSTVEAHLGTCPTCPEEVEVARSARDAVASLPEVEVPVGVTSRVVRTASRERPWAMRAARPLAYAAAAGVIGVAAFLGIRAAISGGAGGDSGAGSQPGTTATRAAGEAEAAELAPVVPYEESDQDFDDGGVQELAGNLALQYTSNLDAAGGPPEEETDQAPAEDGAAALRVATEEALTCLLAGTGVDPEVEVPVRVIAARFRGTPAYLGAFLAGPGAGQPPDRVIIYVVSREACEFLSFARQLL